ncbi:MAG: hypothetical protein WCG67_08125, partial [Ferruginibacter sp.]
SVDKNKNSVVRIYTDIEDSGDVAARTFIGLGTLVSKEGLIVTGDVFADQRGKYLVTLDNAKFYNVSILPRKQGNQFYFLKIIQDENDDFVF